MEQKEEQCTIIDLSGKWKCTLIPDAWEKQPLVASEGEVELPGCLQGQGLGYPITEHTPWVSGLHNPFWMERAEYGFAQADGCKVPFLSQPPMHYLGQAWYERDIVITADEAEQEWVLYLEKTHWQSTLYVDDCLLGEDRSLCTAHRIFCGKLTAGVHHIRLCIDNRILEPYRPDGHEISDALGATWNGVVGEMALLSVGEWEQRQHLRKTYAAAHPRTVEVRQGAKEEPLFYVDDHPEYFRGTHFGGDYPLTGTPSTDVDWWRNIMRVVKKYGLNFIRFHSYCPPEAAFVAADEEDVYLQVECGMWNNFREDSPMLETLRRETRRILEQFGHHPSFVLFSSGNEPGGNWYQVLRRWVEETRIYDQELGYGGRRLYTAQSGWPYEVAPDQVEGTDYLYFHRSGFGSFLGGNIRNFQGWRGGDYEPSIRGTKLPAVCHELGQWCSYPDYRVIEKFTGYLRPGNYEIFQENARARGVLPLAETFAYCSGRNQVRLYKEELEANFRTKGMGGFELLDLHDYLGQGGAFVGILDTFWQSKGYVTPEEFRENCDRSVLLTRLVKYVYTNTEEMTTPVELVHYGREVIAEETCRWRLYRSVDETEGAFIEDGDESVLAHGEWLVDEITPGSRCRIGELKVDFSLLEGIFLPEELGAELTLELRLGDVRNHWQITVFRESAEDGLPDNVCCTRESDEAKKALEAGCTVLYFPHITEMDYECPPLSIRNAFWNAQMGPNWSRSLGLVVDSTHPVFRCFSSSRSGGWQWEDILKRARGFCLDGLPECFPVPVRAIDDWNRNLPLSVFLEAKVGAGRLLLVSADLEGSFAERPAAFCFKQALLRYAVSGGYTEAPECSWEQVARHLFPLMRSGSWLTKEVLLPFRDPNPGQVFQWEGDSFPMEIELPLKNKLMIQGLVYLPVQRDRMFQGCIREYQVDMWRGDSWELICSGCLENSLFSQKILFAEPCETKKIRLRVCSVYGDGDYIEWKASAKGWERTCQSAKPMVQIGALHLICDEEAPGERSVRDDIFWDHSQRSTTKEIDN